MEQSNLTLYILPSRIESNCKIVSIVQSSKWLEKNRTNKFDNFPKESCSAWILKKDKQEESYKKDNSAL